MKIFSLLSLLLLTACVGVHSSQVSSQLYNVGKKEGDSWKLVNELAKERCPQGTNEVPLPRSKALERQDCYDSLINTHIMPVAFAPTLLMDYMLQNREVSISYKNREIDRDQANLKLQENWNNYFKAVVAKGDQIEANAYHRDQQLAIEQQQYFQNLSKELRGAGTKRYVARQETFNRNKTIRTNCHTIGSNNIECRSR